MPINLARKRLRKENFEFETNLSYTARLSHTPTKPNQINQLANQPSCLFRWMDSMLLAMADSMLLTTGTGKGAEWISSHPVSHVKAHMDLCSASSGTPGGRNTVRRQQIVPSVSSFPKKYPVEQINSSYIPSSPQQL